MRKHNDRSARLQVLDVIFEPLELFVSQRAEPSGLQVQHVHQADEMHALLVEAVPPCALRFFAVALEILLPVVVQHVVFAGNENHVLRSRALQNLVHRVEFLRF